MSVDGRGEAVVVELGLRERARGEVDGGSHAPRREDANELVKIGIVLQGNHSTEKAMTRTGKAGYLLGGLIQRVSK